MLVTVSYGVSKIVKSPVNVGSKYLGKYVGSLNHGTGDFYEVLPEVDHKIQRAILKKVKVKDVKPN